METSIHASFAGQCEDAFRYYEKHLGGKIEMMVRHEGSPMASEFPADWQKKIMHGRVRLGNTLLMGVDARPDRYQKAQGYTISLGVDTPAEAERIFAALGDDGTVVMPMQETFFATKFGIVNDRFGIPWMVVCAKPM